MLDLFEILSSTGSHPVRLAENGLQEIITATSPSLIIADAVFRKELTGGAMPVLFLEAVEPSKEMGKIGPLIETCRHHRLARDGRILAIGGGVIQDIACFVASVYMRGIEWAYAPTTLLGMVDSCIGGKSSINVGSFKNLVGTFYPPTSVMIPTNVLATLPPEHIAGGRAEAAKICFARGVDTFDRYLDIDAGPTFRIESAARLVSTSLECKKWFIETDEFDRGERLLLNFGHSFGHAIESCTGYDVSHGVAVAVGCLAAIELSTRRAPSLVGSGRVGALKAQLRAILSGAPHTARSLGHVKRDDFFHYFDSDKKHPPGKYRPVLIDPEALLERPLLTRDVETADAIWETFTITRALISEPSPDTRPGVGTFLIQ